MDTVLLDMLLNQVSVELSNSNQYLTIATKMKSKGLEATAAYFYKQSGEEHGHAEKFINFLNMRGIDFSIPAVPPSQNEPDFDGSGNTIADWAQHYLTMEEENSSLINKIMEESIKVHDNYAQDFLQDFIREQLEEMFSARRFLSLVATTDSAALADLAVKSNFA